MQYREKTFMMDLLIRRKLPFRLTMTELFPWLNWVMLCYYLYHQATDKVITWIDLLIKTYKSTQ